MVRRVTHGNLDQGFGYFKYADMQCTGIAFFALASIFMSNYHGEENLFDERRMDSMIFGGNDFYTTVIDEMYSQQPRYLGHDEMPSTVDIFGRVVENYVHYDMIYGVVGNDGQHNMGSTDIVNGLNTAFTVSPFALLTLNSLTVAFYRNADGRIVLIDSHSRGVVGEPVNSGSAVFIEFDQIEDVNLYLTEVYENEA